MLRKKHRLNKDKQFNAIWQRGLSAYGQTLGLKALPNNLPYSRFAFLINKKVSKRAVVRNLLKRRLREIIRLEWLNLVGYDIVVVVLPPAANSNFDQLKTEVKNLFRRLKIS